MFDISFSRSLSLFVGIDDLNERRFIVANIEFFLTSRCARASITAADLWFLFSKIVSNNVSIYKVIYSINIKSTAQNQRKFNGLALHRFDVQSIIADDLDVID